MKYVINGAMYNWVHHFRSQWFSSWAYWQRNKQLASGGQRIPKRKTRKVVRNG